MDKKYRCVISFDVRRSTFDVRRWVVGAGLLTAGCVESEGTTRVPTLLSGPDISLFAVAGDGKGGDALTTPSMSVTWTKLTEAERAQLKLEKGEVESLEPTPRVDAATLRKEALVAKATTMGASEELWLVLTLPDPEDFASTLPGLDDAQRQAAIKARVSRLTLAHDAAEVALKAVGARDVQRMWLANQMTARVAAPHVPAIVTRLNVKDVGVVGTRAIDFFFRWGGDRVRSEQGFGSFISAGYRGQGGGWAGASTPVRVGIVERPGIANWVSWYHPGLSTGRLTNARLCTAAIAPGGNVLLPCQETPGDFTPLYPAPTDGGADPSDTHGTGIAGLVAGSIEGSAAEYPGNVTAQVQRSGVASGAQMQYRSFDDTTVGLIHALQEAVYMGADIVNMSFGTGALCPPAGYDEEGLNAVLRSTLDAGLLLVGATGNQDHAGACNIAYPASQPEVLAVSGFDSQNDTQSLSQTKMGYGHKGGLPIKNYWTSTPRTRAGVDTLAASHFLYGYGHPLRNKYRWQQGASGAAAVVSGGAAVFKHGVRALYNVNLTGKFLIPQFLVMSDSFSWFNDTDPNTLFRRVAPVWRGRLRCACPRRRSAGLGVGVRAPSRWRWATSVSPRSRKPSRIIGTRSVGTARTQTRSRTSTSQRGRCAAASSRSFARRTTTTFATSFIRALSTSQAAVLCASRSLQ